MRERNEPLVPSGRLMGRFHAEVQARPVMKRNWRLGFVGPETEHFGAQARAGPMRKRSVNLGFAGLTLPYVFEQARPVMKRAEPLQVLVANLIEQEGW